MRLPISLAAALALLLAACGGSDDTASLATSESSATTEAVETTIPETTVPETTEAPATTEETTTTEATTTATLDPLTQSQTAYYLITSDTNGRRFEMNERYGAVNGVLWSDMPAFCAEQAVIDEDVIRMLGETAWIPDAQDEIDEMIAASIASLTYTYQCASAPGTFEAQSVISDASLEASNRAGEAASAVRFALGLPIDRG
jgi:hypothetical protein